MLVTLLGDTEERTRYLNARSTIGKLLEWRSVPVINENDTVATTEIRYGDNDRLAARVATMTSADLLVLLSDVDGLYDAPPAKNAKAKHIPLVPRITREIEAMAGEAASDHARGGMRTKIEAGKIATTAGVHMVIASGHVDNPLSAIAAGGRASWFLTPANPVTARKKWIAGSLEPKGTLTIDAGAVAALRRGKSLLPAGVVRSTERLAAAMRSSFAVRTALKWGADWSATTPKTPRKSSASRRAISCSSSASRAAPRWCIATIWCWAGSKPT